MFVEENSLLYFRYVCNSVNRFIQPLLQLSDEFAIILSNGGEGEQGEIRAGDADGFETGKNKKKVYIIKRNSREKNPKITICLL